MSVDQVGGVLCALPGLTPEVYARWRASVLGSTNERLERRLMMEYIGDVHGKTVLEIGCGEETFRCFLPSWRPASSPLWT
jgi:hypothetical protein